MSLPAYKAAFTKHFERSLKSETKRDNLLKERIEQAIQEMMIEPYKDSELLHDEYSGKRRTYVGKHRILYAVCEECRKLGHEKHNRCQDCSSLAGNTIVYFDVNLRKVAYER
jgi:mRNA-degrading endonuclease RelE of RelBE toxin-antitoxin system